MHISHLDLVYFSSCHDDYEGKYIIDSGRHASEDSVVLNALHKKDHGEPQVAIKFYRQEAAYKLEEEFFCNNRESPYVPQVRDSWHEHANSVTGQNAEINAKHCACYRRSMFLPLMRLSPGDCLLCAV